MPGPCRGVRYVKLLRLEPCRRPQGRLNRGLAPICNKGPEGAVLARIDAFLKLGIQQGCSDIHLAVGVPPMLRLHGDLLPIKFRELRDSELEGYIAEILTPTQQETFGKG